MTDAAHDSARNLSPGLGVLLTGLVVLVLPEPVVLVVGLGLLYGLGALAGVCGVMNLLTAFRVRELARWLLPTSLLAGLLAVAALAAPAVVASGLTRALGLLVMAGGAVVLRGALQDSTSAPLAAAPARRAARRG
jgi:uncharacterized membrane protein HdeD (DUF308 family)